MKAIKSLGRKFLAAKEGLETIEYAIIAGLIVVGTIGTIVTIGVWVGAKFTALNTTLQGN